MWKNVLICLVISPAFFPVLTGWCSVSVWETILVLQVPKTILFSTTCEDLLSRSSH